MTILRGQKQRHRLQILVSDEVLDWLQNDVCKTLWCDNPGTAARALILTLWREANDRKREAA